MRVLSWTARLILIAPLVACGDSGITLPGGGGEGGGTAGENPGGSAPFTTSSTGGNGGAPEPTAFADAGADLEVDTGASIQLSGQASYSDLGRELTYQWAQTSGPQADIFSSDWLLMNANAPTIPGTITFSLVVSDSTGPSAPDEVSVVVHNRLPKANAGHDKSALEGESVTLDGLGMDPDMDVISFTWSQVSGPAVELSDPTAAAPSLTIPDALDEPLVYELIVADPYDDSEPDWVTIRRVAVSDSDGDLLDDAEEAALGTDPNDADTDRDGIPDGWEALGHEEVDYAALGCDPLHRDLLIELDYQSYVDADGVAHQAEFHPRVLAALEAFYTSLPVANPDGTQGIDLHIVLDSLLAEDFVCNYIMAPGQWSPPNFLYREAFHKIALCNGVDGAWAQGYADIGGRNIWLTVDDPNDDPSDDATESALTVAYAIFIHEMGHNFGVKHGGNDWRNYKVNYPSVMNYAYGFGLDADPPTLDAPDIDFSHGLLPPLDECALVERNALAASPPEAWAPLAAYTPGYLSVEPDGSVDFNHDGTIADQPYELVFADGNGGSCGIMNDNDDFAIIDGGIANAIPSNPNAIIAFGLWGEQTPPGAP